MLPVFRPQEAGSWLLSLVVVGRRLTPTKVWGPGSSRPVPSHFRSHRLPLLLLAAQRASGRNIACIGYTRGCQADESPGRAGHVLSLVQTGTQPLHSGWGRGERERERERVSQGRAATRPAQPPFAAGRPPTAPPCGRVAPLHGACAKSEGTLYGAGRAREGVGDPVATWKMIGQWT